MSELEDLPGAAENERALTIRSFAWRILAAQFSEDTLQNSEAALDAVAAGIRMQEINTEAADVRRIYALDDVAPTDALNVIREQLRLRQLDGGIR